MQNRCVLKSVASIFGGASVSKAMSLKAKIRNIAKTEEYPCTGHSAELYVLSVCLVRLSASEYKEKFVLKGRYVGSRHCRTRQPRKPWIWTTTLKNLPLHRKQFAVRWKMFVTSYSMTALYHSRLANSPIREDDIYGGYRVVMLNAKV